MTRRYKEFSVLAISAGGCLAAGLWIQDRFLVAATRWEQQQAAAENRPPVERDLPLVKALSFAWICGLQTGVLWLITMRMQGEAERRRLLHNQEGQRREKELIRTQEAIIFGLAKLAESRDPDTGHHLERISHYSTRLATALRRRPRFREAITQSFINSLGLSSALHDIGKVGIEDAILLKEGPLTPAERSIMQRHTTIGGDCIRQIQRRIGNSGYLQMALDIALGHHEHWNGGGYPARVRGEAIPLSARIVAIADVYDALSVARCYKGPLPHEECVEIIRRGAGQHFDPEIVDVFLSIQDQFREISDRFAEDQSTRVSRTVANRRALAMTAHQERLLLQALNPAYGGTDTEPTGGAAAPAPVPADSSAPL